MIFILLLVVIDAYLTGSWLHALLSSHFSWYWFSLVILQSFFVALGWLFFVFFRSSADAHVSFEKPIRTYAFYGMGIISFLLVFTLLRDLTALVFLLFGNAGDLYGTIPTLSIGLVSVICVVIGAFNARFRILSPRVNIPVKDLPTSLQGLKIVQLSDIHLGTGPALSQVGRMVTRALSLQPDLIVLTGDIIDGNIPEITAELDELKKLKAPHGTYFVLGNHECYWNPLAAIAALKERGIEVLQNSGHEILIHGEKIFIAGMNDPAIAQIKGAAPEVTIPPSDSKLNVMLVHQPGFAEKIAQQPYHLQLSGHTHGGQFFPWNLAVKKVHTFDQGLARLKNLWIYVNVGTGYWGPPIRLGSQCEITQLVMVSE